MLDYKTKPDVHLKTLIKSSDGALRILGLDVGIASCGWAIIDIDKNGVGTIIDMGVWLFDVPETDKERTPTNQQRRQFRGQGRVIRRRRQRMNEIRALLKEKGLLESDKKDALGVSLNMSPWQLRVEGLSRKLTDLEFAVVLGHIAKHRGFRSNAKQKSARNQSDDSSKMLKAIGSR